MLITFHSYKGGTGKTLLATNLATVYANRGKRVCLLDLDLRAPSLCFIFKNGKNPWVNDYLNRVCEIDDVLTDCSPESAKGKLFVGFANPATEAIREMAAKDRKWEMQALARLLSLKTVLRKDRHFDHVILDTSPGLRYSSINAIVSADAVLVVTTLEQSDVEGAQRMIHDLYDLFEKKTGIIVNKVLSEFLSPKTLKRELAPLETQKTPIVEAVPCFCDVLKARGEGLFASEKPNHPFTKTVRKIAAKIEQDQLLATKIMANTNTKSKKYKKTTGTCASIQK